MFQSNAFQSFAFQSVGFASAPAPAIIGGHFLPAKHKNKATLSNVHVVFERAKQLPRAQTKELRDAISEFVPPEVARIAEIPDVLKVDYEALSLNEAAYNKFAIAVKNIEERLEIAEKTGQYVLAKQQRVILEKQQQEDDELLLMATIASIIH